MKPRTRASIVDFSISTTSLIVSNILRRFTVISATSDIVLVLRSMLEKITYALAK